ncbi:MAG: hypothetical protein U1E58_06755 [Tabrizicola sp.]
MPDENELVPARNSIGWYEATIPIRGCALDLDQIKKFYVGLARIKREFGEKVISTLTKDADLDDGQWIEKKRFLLDDAFRVSITVRGHQNEQLYSEDQGILQADNLPLPIRSISLTNASAWQRNAQNSMPPNRVEVLLDFGKPPLIDPATFVSEPTPNSSVVTISAHDMMYFRAVRQLVDEKLLGKRTIYSTIHRSYSYDVGIWLIALPAALLLATYYMDKWLPAAGPHSSYRWAFFIYAVGTVLVGYRVLVSYTKWAFPVTVLKENKDSAWKHRAVIGGVLAWLFYKAVDIVWGLLTTI